MKNPRLKKLKDFRKGAAQARHQRSFWKNWDKLGTRVKTVPVPVEPDEPQMDEAAELYSEYRLIIEDGANGSVSCRIQEN